MISKAFISRPVLSIVLSIVIVIIGIAAIFASPVAQYPQIVPPSIVVTATFPGASAATLADTVASPLEDQLAGVSNELYMQSTSASTSGSVSITIYFQVGTNLNEVLGDVLNRVNSALPSLPTSVQSQGIVVRKKSPDIFMVIPFYPESSYPSDLTVSNYVYRYVVPVISQLPGVGVISVGGGRQYGMRIWLDPNKLAYYQLTPGDITAAIKDQNAQYSIGLDAMSPTDGQSKYQFMMLAHGYMTSPEEFKNIVIKANNNNVVKLGDVAKVELAAQQYNTSFIRVLKNSSGQVESRQMTAMMVYLDPQANQLEVKKEIMSSLDKLSHNFPRGMTYYVHYDSSQFVTDSIAKVIETLRDSFVLVFLVILLFIQSLRGTIIPMIAIPVAIIGTFAGTYALGFSINTMTLFGMILAIGIVVDDAIVVLENVERIMKEDKLNSLDATIKGMEEVQSPVIAIVLVLCSVFVPVAFLGGFTGILFKQFAVAIAISVFLSGLVALTLTPTLCVMFLKNVDPDHKPNKFFQQFNIWFDWFRDRYVIAVKWLIKHVKTSALIFVGITASAVFMYTIVPGSLIPLEDMGNFYTSMNLPSASSLDRTNVAAVELGGKYLDNPAIDKVGVISGMDMLDNGASKTSAGMVISMLKPYDKRTENVDQVLAYARGVAAKTTDARVVSFNQPPIRGLSTTGGVQFYLVARDNVTVEQIKDDSIKLVQYLQKNYPVVSSAQQFYDTSVPQLYVDIDPEKSKYYQVTYADVYNSIQSIYGTTYVNYFNYWHDLWWVILQAEYKYRNKPEQLSNIFVRSATGAMVPVANVAKVKWVSGAEVVTRFNDFLASQIMANPADGHTTGEVMAAINDALPKALGNNYTVNWFGSSYQESIAGSSAAIAVLMGLIMVYLILAALYEMWLLPMSILLALPFVMFGALVMLLLKDKPNDIYFQVSLLTLVGLSAKNAILIVEFALEGVKKHGMSIYDAAVEAARLRFRPIVMTSLAFILGNLPLMFATGAGANSQRSVGTGIIGGMIGSTLLATLFVPLFFVIIMKISTKKKKV